METVLWNLLDLDLDLALAGLLLGLGWAAVASPDLKRGVILFVAFGLLIAITWARLRAPDLALAEAAIGAGISGALLLSALRDDPSSKAGDAIATGPVAWMTALLTPMLAGLFGWALLTALPNPGTERLAGQVAANLVDSGVTNPVTAVLLNFRAYDTLLELAVLLAALLGIFALGPARPGFKEGGPVLDGLIRWLVPQLVITGGYLLWVGAHAPEAPFRQGRCWSRRPSCCALAVIREPAFPGPCSSAGCWQAVSAYSSWSDWRSRS